MDGVLIDTEKYLTRFWQQAAREAGLEMELTECYLFRSFASKFASAAFREKYGDSYDYDAIRNRRKELMKAHLEKNGIEIKPQVKETLQALKEQGYCLAVVTATDEERTEKYLKESGIYDWFDSVICATMVERGKPFPDVYLYACQQIGFSPEMCMAAFSAGLKTVMVPDLTLPDEELKKKVVGVAPSLGSVLKYVEAENKMTKKESRG